MRKNKNYVIVVLNYTSNYARYKYNDFYLNPNHLDNKFY